jgi:hypothetical protein
MEVQMKPIIKGKIVSIDEMSSLITNDGCEGITYRDVEKLFSKGDLDEYNDLCNEFVKIIGNKGNKEQWDLIFDPSDGMKLMRVLNKIEILRDKYFLPGKFHRIWKAKSLENGKFEYDEIFW